MNYKADEMFLEADKLIANNQIKEARSLLYNIVEEYPDYGRAHNHLGWLNEHKLRYLGRAEEHYKAALRFSPDYPAVWANYSYFLSNLERFEELEVHLRKALEVKGVSKSMVYNELGSMTELQGKYEKAQEYYQQAIRYSLNDESIESYEKSIKRAEKKGKISF